MENAVIFYPLAILTVLFAGLAIKFRNIFYSLLSAMMVFLLTAVIFYILGSEYNAIIQAAIYGFAIPVILGLAVMFTGAGSNKHDGYSYRFITTVIFVCGLFIIAVSALFLTQSFNFAEEIYANSTEVIQAISGGIYIKYVFAFEVLSAILTMVAAGLTMFKHGRAK